MKQRFISKLRSWVETETTGYTTPTHRPWVHFVANNEKECRRFKLDDFDIEISEGLVYVMKDGFIVSPFDLNLEQFQKIKQELTLENLK